jgi:hypothetical protein
MICGSEFVVAGFCVLLCLFLFFHLLRKKLRINLTQPIFHSQFQKIRFFKVSVELAHFAFLLEL